MNGEAVALRRQIERGGRKRLAGQRSLDLAALHIEI
jgi:hypothetical protein